MALDFPNSPTAGQLYAAPNGVTYQWSSTYTAWLPLAVTSAGVGDFFSNMTVSGWPATPTVYGVTVVTGNAGGWYNVGTGRFTPPAGRYHLFAGGYTGNSTVAIGATISLRKNGTVVNSGSQYAAVANALAQVMVADTLDANGTDYFEIQIGASAATNMTGYLWFGAFPISAAGPAAGTGSSWRRIARVVPVAGQATIDFQNIPADINDLELRFAVSPATNNANLYMRFYDASGVLDATASHYLTMNGYTQLGATAGGSVTSYHWASTSSAIVFNLNSANWGASNANNSIMDGRATINNIRDIRTKVAHFSLHYVESTQTYNAWLTGVGERHAVSGAITGLRLSWDTGNFAAGGAVSLYGSP